jgi:uncharacterized membrane protein
MRHARREHAYANASVNMAPIYLWHPSIHGIRQFSFDVQHVMVQAGGT